MAICLGCGNPHPIRLFCRDCLIKEGRRQETIRKHVEFYENKREREKMEPYDVRTAYNQIRTVMATRESREYKLARINAIIKLAEFTDRMADINIREAEEMLEDLGSTQDPIFIIEETTAESFCMSKDPHILAKDVDIEYFGTNEKGSCVKTKGTLIDMIRDRIKWQYERNLKK